MEKVQVDSEVTRLRVLKSAYEGKRYTLQDAFAIQYPQRIATKEKELQDVMEKIRIRDAEMEKNASFEITLRGITFTGRKEAGQALRSIAEKRSGIFYEPEEIGRYKGIQVLMCGRFQEARIQIAGNGTEFIKLGDSDIGNLVRLENLVHGLDKAAEEVREKIEIYKTEMKNAELEYGKPFQYEETLKAALKRQAEINMQLEFQEHDGWEAEMAEEENTKEKRMEEKREEEREPGEREPGERESEERGTGKRGPGEKGTEKRELEEKGAEEREPEEKGTEEKRTPVEARVVTRNSI